MTKLYALDLRQCDVNHWLDLLPTLPEDRQQRGLACRFPEDQSRTAGAGWLLQSVLEQAGIPAAQQRFTRNPWGKPQLSNQEDLQFSLSHSGPWVVCALSDTPVGVDVEQPRCTPAVAKRYFQPAELENLDRVDAVALTRLWTAKEAFVKALGRGLTMPLNSFSVRLTPNGAVLDQTQSSAPYRLHEYDLSPCRLCLCTVDERPKLTFVAIQSGKNSALPVL